MPNYFDDLKNGRLQGASGTERRIRHSFTNYFRSIDRTSFGAKPKGEKFGMDPVNTRNAVATSGSSVGNVMGTLGLAAGIAVAAVAATAGAAAIVVIAGPGFAIVAGLVGLGLAAKSAYSNREGAHEKLRKYCWNLVDNEAPEMLTVANIGEALDAAMTLLDDGKSQYKLIAAKLSTATTELNNFHQKLKANEDKIANMSTTLTDEQKQAIVLDAKEDTERRIAKAKEMGGPIYNYVRRMMHTGNYLQAPYILAIALQEKMSPGTLQAASTAAQTDYFASAGIAANSRAYFLKLEDLYKTLLATPGHTGTTTSTTMLGNAPLVNRTKAYGTP